MTVSPMKTARPAPKLTCTWVPVRGADGRTRMEMRWIDESRRSARRAA
ncbi:hypothetical protein NMQ01_10155 [Janibacter sp. CX7]|nr:hypothetical protein [Janibacter sp. CX7]UTT65087.1 hypothetical protein NMQ01_10155 [Janibacter sp. CX7]